MFSFLKKKNVDPATALRRALSGYTLPSFSKADLELMRRIRQPNSSSNEIAEVLELDPALSVKLLKLANSATYTPRHEVTSVSMAVSLLGLSELESLVMTATLKKGIPPCEHESLSTVDFWTTSAFRGVLARDLATRLCPARTTECFTAGFLQDLAIPFLLSERPDDYAPIIDTWHAGDAFFLNAERELFTWDHAQVATWIADKWELPENLASAIGGHHTPEDPDLDCPLPVALVANLSGSEESVARLSKSLEAYFAKESIGPLIESARQSSLALAKFML